MRFLERPTSEKEDPVIHWEQDVFRNIYRDIPGSEIPNDGLADAKDILLLGSGLFVRPGDEIHSATALPVDSTQPFSSGIAKSGTSVTHSGNGFTTAHVGKYLLWNDGSSSLIVAFVSAGEVTVDDSTAQADTDVTIRSPIWGNIFYKKSKKIILHIGSKLYHTSWDFSDGWNEIYFPKGSSLNESPSSFRYQDKFIYLFNSNGIFLIDFTDTTNIRLMQMNMTSPLNTISPATDEKTDNPAVVTSYPPTSIETNYNVFGRRYLFTMSKLDGLLTASRGDGTRIIKESGSNQFPESNGYIDYKESWRMHGFQNGELVSNRTRGNILINLTNAVLYQFQIAGNSYFRITIGGITREVSVNFAYNPLKDWYEITEVLENAIKSIFPEHEYLKCIFDSTGYILIHSGDSSVSITGLLSGLSGFDLTASGYLNDWVQIQLTNWNAIGTKASPALQAMSGQFGYTHFSVYSTLTLGQDDTVNGEYFIWQKDIPIIKPMVGIISSSGDIYIIDSEILLEDLSCYVYDHNGNSVKIEARNSSLSNSGNIHNDGSLINGTSLSSGSNTSLNTNHLIDSAATFVSDGIRPGMIVLNTYSATIDRATIISVSETDLTLDTDIFTATSQNYLAGGGPIVIGSQEPLFLTKSGTTVTKDTLSVGSFDFVSDDIGKLLFWSNGEIDIITGINSVNSLEVENSGTISVPIAAAFEPSGRNYNDTVTDTLLDQRSIDFPILNRFHAALPNSDLGEITPGFMVVATDGDTKGYYSQYSNRYAYLVGHYYAEFQNFVMKDLIKELSESSSQLFVFCKNSTWKFQTNVVQSVNDPRVGESISILSGHSVVDENIGISDKMGVASYGNGFKLIATSEPGLRTFDGYRYSRNRTMDEKGRGHIKNDFQILKNKIVLHYEPNLYGLMIWGSNATYVDNNGLPLLRKSNQCFRLALEEQQGFGFSELSGSRWNFVELNHRPMLITDDKEDKFTILFDNRLGYPHRLSTRRLPDTGNNNYIEYNFKDNEDVGGGNGTEITSSFKLKEHIAREEQTILKYMEEYLFFRPYLESNKNQSGYDQYGFRTGQEITVKIYTDGNGTEVSEAHTVHPKATIYQPYDFESRRIQTEIFLTTSEILFTKIKALYKNLKNRYIANEQNERSYQDTFANFIFRVSRGYPKDLDLATGNENTNTDAVFTEVTGPDGQSNSAIQFSEESSYLSFPAFTNTYRYIIFSIKADINADGGTIYDEYINTSSSRVKIVLNGNLIQFYTNGVLSLSTITLEDDTWYTVMLYIFPGTPHVIVLYSNSNLIVSSTAVFGPGDSSLLPSYEIRIGEGLNSFHQLFDIMVFDYESDTITSDMFLYYIRDLYKYNGFSLIPPALTADTEE